MDFQNIYKSSHLKEATPEQIAAFRAQGKSDDEIRAIFAEDPSTNDAQLNELLSVNAAPNPVDATQPVAATPMTEPLVNSPAETEQAVADVNEVVDSNEQETQQSLAELNKAVENSEMSSDDKAEFAKLSQETEDIQKSLNEYIKKFKADPAVVNMLNRYTGKEAKQQAKLGESMEHMYEEKGGFKYHYKNFLKSAGKIRVWAIIALALVVVAVGGSIGGIIKKICKTAKNSSKMDDVIDKTLSDDNVGNNVSGDKTLSNLTTETPGNLTTETPGNLTTETPGNLTTETPATPTPASFTPGSNPAQLVDPNTPVTCKNTIEDQANATPGMVIQRNDGSKYVLTQGDIDWAKKQVNKTAPTDTIEGSNVNKKLEPIMIDDKDIKLMKGPEMKAFGGDDDDCDHLTVTKTPISPKPTTTVKPTTPVRPTTTLNPPRPNPTPASSGQRQPNAEELRVLTGLGQKNAQLEAQLKQKEAEFAAKAKNFNPTGPNQGPDPALEQEINNLRGEIARNKRAQKNIEKGPQYRGRAAQKAMGQR